MKVKIRPEVNSDLKGRETCGQWFWTPLGQNKADRAFERTVGVKRNPEGGGSERRVKLQAARNQKRSHGINWRLGFVEQE